MRHCNIQNFTIKGKDRLCLNVQTQIRVEFLSLKNRLSHSFLFHQFLSAGGYGKLRSHYNPSKLLLVGSLSLRHYSLSLCKSSFPFGQKFVSYRYFRAPLVTSPGLNSDKYKGMSLAIVKSFRRPSILSCNCESYSAQEDIHNVVNFEKKFLQERYDMTLVHVILRNHKERIAVPCYVRLFDSVFLCFYNRPLFTHCDLVFLAV